MKVKEIQTLIANRTHWVPVKTKLGYQLVSRGIPYPLRNFKVSATFVVSLEEAADLIGRNYGIRMGEPGATSGNYHYPKDLRIIWA